MRLRFQLVTVSLALVLRRHSMAMRPRRQRLIARPRLRPRNRIPTGRRSARKRSNRHSLKTVRGSAAIRAEMKRIIKMSRRARTIRIARPLLTISNRRRNTAS
jgi:hypothetical protein